MIKNDKGITIISLVVSIIVLLLLAGISIITLTGENGILTKSKDSKIKTKESQIREKIRLAYNSALIEGLGNITESLFETELNKIFGERNINYTLTDSQDGSEWIVEKIGTNVTEYIPKSSVKIKEKTVEVIVKTKDGDILERWWGTITYDDFVRRRNTEHKTLLLMMNMEILLQKRE